jgi:serine/threonine protein phosphatase 1
MTIYAVGDIHGQRAMLEDALALIEADGGRDARVVFLGDYVDRGPDSAGVLETLAQGRAAGRDWICLMGNHDRMMRHFLEELPRSDPYMLVTHSWFHPNIGGRETLASYDLHVDDSTRLFQVHTQAQDAIPDRHKQFLDDLDIYHETDDLLFVHAGIRPGIPLADQTEDDMVWIRGEFHRDTRAYPWLVVHGHTPVDEATHYGNRINLDTGAGYGRPLSVAVFEGRECSLLTPRGRKLLRPKVG